MSKAEKFIQLNTKTYSNETRITIGRNSHWEKQPWLTPEQALRAVDIARKEVIDKACEWLQDNIDRYLYNTGGIDEYIPKCGGKMIEDFKQKMEE